MTLIPNSYTRKPFEVTGAQVTDENLEEVADWCGGVIRTDEKTGLRQIIVPVKKPLHSKQRIAREGCWVLFSNPELGFKVYSDKAFRNTFEASEDTAEETPETDAK